MLCCLCFSHILHELDGFGWSAQLSTCRCAHHHESLTWLCAKFRKVGVIFELTAFHQNLLPVWLDAGQRVDLEFEDLAEGGWVEVDIIFFALMFDDN